ncbi:MAG: GTPase Era, partial [Clostridia bacterium]|nr:GTPase Era [Clostridia bacterium]
EKLRGLDLPIILVLNKTDLANPAQIAETITAYAALGEYASVIPLCAMKNDGIAIVLDEAEKVLPEGDFIFDEDELTDQPERQIASEVIREKILRTTDDEIPHGCAVVIEEFKESRDMVKIRAEIYCERESHKRILIGKGGATLKTIGSYAREDLEKFFGVKIYLDLWVRVKENWRDKPSAVYDFGYKPQDND